VAFRPEAVKNFLDDNYVGAREDRQDAKNKVTKEEAERLVELFEKLLSEPWGRELFYETIVNADILKINTFTGNSHTYYNEGLQAIAKRNMAYVKQFHFKDWLKMEQEAYNRRSKEIE